VKITREVLFKGRSTWLRLERTGQEFTTSINHDGKEWVEMGVLTSTFPNRVQVGIAAVNVSNHALVADYEDFKVLKE
jgi:regulation of enolase protein 1 (concanavalin A-like superfamily)